MRLALISVLVLGLTACSSTEEPNSSSTTEDMQPEVDQEEPRGVLEIPDERLEWSREKGDIQNLTLKNRGTGPLEIVHFSFEGTNVKQRFDIQTEVPFEIEPDDTTYVPIEYIGPMDPSRPFLTTRLIVASTGNDAQFVEIGVDYSIHDIRIDFTPEELAIEALDEPVETIAEATGNYVMVVDEAVIEPFELASAFEVTFDRNQRILDPGDGALPIIVTQKTALSEGDQPELVIDYAYSRDDERPVEQRRLPITPIR